MWDVQSAQLLIQARQQQPQGPRSPSAVTAWEHSRDYTTHPFMSYVPHFRDVWLSIKIKNTMLIKNTNDCSYERKSLNRAWLSGIRPGVTLRITHGCYGSARDCDVPTISATKPIV